MIDINDAVNLFGAMFNICFWASMMIVLVYSIKIVFVVIDKVKNFNTG